MAKQMLETTELHPILPSAVQRSGGSASLFSALPTATSIRLFQLTAGRRWTPLSGNLFVVDLQDNPLFEALSYEWHQTKARGGGSISLGNSDMTVGENLADALEELRYSDKNRLLWIDALCIDQITLLERNHQVGLMSKIYGQAQNVVVWLGPASENSDIAMDFLDLCAKYHKEPKLPLNIIDESTASRDRIEALINLFERTYWRRVWVIQEMILAPSITIFCGSRSADWKALKLATAFQLDMRTKDVPYSLMTCEAGFYYRNSRAATPMQSRGTSRAQENLRHWLQVSQGSECTEVRDKIYGLLALAEDRHLFTIDYTKPVTEIYRDIMLAYAEDTTIFQFSELLQKMLSPMIVSPDRRGEVIMLDGLLVEVFGTMYGSPVIADPFLPFPKPILEGPVPRNMQLRVGSAGSEVTSVMRIDENSIEKLEYLIKPMEMDKMSITLLDHMPKICKHWLCIPHIRCPADPRQQYRLCFFEHSDFAVVLRYDSELKSYEFLGRAIWVDSKPADFRKRWDTLGDAKISESDTRRVRLMVDVSTLQNISSPAVSYEFEKRRDKLAKLKRDDFVESNPAKRRKTSSSRIELEH